MVSKYRKKKLGIEIESPDKTVVLSNFNRNIIHITWLFQYYSPIRILVQILNITNANILWFVSPYPDGVSENFLD